MVGEKADADIGLHNVRKTFGETIVIPDLSAELRAGEFTVILGPSGCGKSTLLNCVAGLERVTSGKITIARREVQDDEPKNRGIAMVFQNYALYPHMSVADNIGYALKVARVPKAERARRVADAAALVELGEYLERRPSQLSGGQRQRVAIARAIVREPEVLLYDEPLSNLDAKLRHEMRMGLSKLHKRLGSTSVFVTHDQVEAMTLADRIMILNKGQIEQFAPPEEIYHKPATTFVGGFIGSPPMNLVEAVAGEGSLRLSDGTVITDTEARGRFTVGIRPELIRLSHSGVPAKVTYREDLGSHHGLVVTLPDMSSVRISIALGDKPQLGSDVRLQIPADAVHLFDPHTGKRAA